MAASDPATSDQALIEAARAWLAEDPDPQTRDQLAALIERVDGADAAATVELADAFRGPLEFGTAGLRGALGPGPNRMNRVVVARAAAGLAAYLHQIGATGPVVIGYDGRHCSDVFATDSAELIAGAGFDVRLFDSVVPTPVVAFAIGALNASAAVVVTASHNPPADNGYKVYLGDGSQIVPPADAEIAAAITAIGPIAELPRATYTSIGADLVDAYVARAATVAEGIEVAPLVVAHTALHGVGTPVVRAAVSAAGFEALHEVDAQAEPDPDFPTVAFPNPEEPGAIDLLLEQARAVHADLAIANDPDADRCAVAIPDPGTQTGWRMLRGDELGCLLGEYVLERSPDPASVTLASSVVSSRLLQRIATDAGARYVPTLTGFKWIGRVAGLTFGYEEALGYCCDPGAVRDKDGITALLLVLSMATRAKADGRTLTDLLDDQARRFGVYAQDQLSIRVDDLSRICELISRLRDNPPSGIGPVPVSATADLATPEPGGLPPTEGLVFMLTDDSRVIVRPSGTEPKLKCYLEVIEPVTDPGQLEASRERAKVSLRELRAGLAGLLS